MSKVILFVQIDGDLWNLTLGDVLEQLTKHSV